MAENVLYYGDNLDILRRYVQGESVDLIYLDPPFKSNQDYNILFKERNGSQSAAQIRAFEDTWRWDIGAERAYKETVEAGGNVSRFLQAMRSFLGESDMMAYLGMMAPRLVELRRVLKPTGSIYLHCDPTASGHLRLLMDAVFGAENFRNEVIWHYMGRRMKASRRFNSKYDVLLFYAKSAACRIVEYPTEPYHREEYLRMKKQRLHVDEKGREWIWGHAGEGKSHHYRIYIDDVLAKGRAVDNVWGIPFINTSAKERLGYPTQKPEALLERIVKASSNEGDIVLDPFCGCGTAVAVAQRLKRRWIGIDITHLAVALIRHRLRDTFGEKVIYDGQVVRAVDYEVVGEPVATSGAAALAQQDPYQFQWWALGLVGARPADPKKGADKGMDGRIYFHDEPKGKTKQIILQVKAGHTGPAHVRDLRGVVEREQAEIGVLITLQESTRSMIKEAASAGFYTSPVVEERTYARIQLLTIEQLFHGKQIDYPHGSSATFRKAPKAKREGPQSNDLFEK